MNPVIADAIRALGLPEGSRGMDAGCGIGMQAFALAEAIGKKGHVIGLDFTSEFLCYAQKSLNNNALESRVSFCRGDVRNIPFKDRSFHWIWSSNCAGYAPFLEPVPVLKEMVRKIIPGGLIALLVWSSQKLLPGYPLLEARLDATSSGLAPWSEEQGPHSHYSRLPGNLKKAGLKHTSVKTFVRDVQAPLTKELYDALTDLLDMRWSNVQPELTSEEYADYTRLCLPSSPDFILKLPDYYAFFTCSLFCGRIPG